jgi:hypothetical protein
VGNCLVEVFYYAFVSKFFFPPINFFSQEFLPELVGKKLNSYLFFHLWHCDFATISFDLLMFKGAHDIFALMIKFLKAY